MEPPYPLTDRIPTSNTHPIHHYSSISHPNFHIQKNPSTGDIPYYGKTWNSQHFQTYWSTPNNPAVSNLPLSLSNTHTLNRSLIPSINGNYEPDNKNLSHFGTSQYRQIT